MDTPVIENWTFEHPCGAHFSLYTREGINEERSKVYCPVCGEQLDLTKDVYYSPYILMTSSHDDAEKMLNAVGYSLDN